MKPPKRSFVSLLTALSFMVLAASGILAFARPFSIRTTGLHTLTGFIFIGLIALHLINNHTHLNRYIKSNTIWKTSFITLSLSFLFLWQPAPIQRVLGWSQNRGPAMDRFEVTNEGMTYHYNPAPDYRMTLNIRAGKAFKADTPPHVAIWLENASFYHIKTLHQPEDTLSSNMTLPYWDFKMRGWEKAKQEADDSENKPSRELEVDTITGATQNSSFDPADYILPSDPGKPMPYRLLIEINQPEDTQPSLVYTVTIDNADPRTYQLLELMGYPEREENDPLNQETWSLYYVNETITTALNMIDSALLTINRSP